MCACLQTNCLEELTRPAPEHAGVTGRSDWVHIFHSVLPVLSLHNVDEGRVASALRSTCAALVAKHNPMFRAAGVAVWEMRFRVPGGAWRLLVSCPTGKQTESQQLGAPHLVCLGFIQLLRLTVLLTTCPPGPCSSLLYIQRCSLASLCTCTCPSCHHYACFVRQRLFPLAFLLPSSTLKCSHSAHLLSGHEAGEEHVEVYREKLTPDGTLVYALPTEGGVAPATRGLHGKPLLAPYTTLEVGGPIHNTFDTAEEGQSRSGLAL